MPLTPETEVNFLMEAMARLMRGAPLNTGLTAVLATLDYLASHVSNPEQRAALVDGLRQAAAKIEAHKPEQEH